MAAMDRERRWQSSQANAVGLRKVEIRKGDLQCHLSRLSATSRHSEETESIQSAMYLVASMEIARLFSSSSRTSHQSAPVAGNFHLKSQCAAPSAMVCVRTKSTPNSRAAQ